MTRCTVGWLICYAVALLVYFEGPADGFVSRSWTRSGLRQIHATPDDTSQSDASNEKAPEIGEKTLYEILQASPTATRAELKKSYAAMARLSHPDAQIGNDNAGTQEVPDFGQVAEAWRILGDSKRRRRYDRELQYREWSATASKYANEKLEEAVPTVAKIMDNVAVPFIRRTAATTFAVGQAVSNLGKAASKTAETVGSSNNNQGLGDAFQNAVNAGRKAALSVDSMELSDKSRELTQKAEMEQKKADKIQEELDTIVEKRLLGTLNSDEFKMSSEEAQLVLDRLLANDSDNDFNTNKIERQIASLQETEQLFVDKLKVYEESDTQWSSLLEKQEGARNELIRRKNEEAQARKRLEEAIQMVAEAKANLVTSSSALQGIEQKVKKNAMEMDRVTFTLSKKQERLRASLKKKASHASSGIQMNYLTVDEVVALKRREIQLTSEQEQSTRMVSRLSSRAAKLKSRANALERYQKSLPSGPEEGGPISGAVQS